MNNLAIEQLNREAEIKAITCEIMGSTLFDADLSQTSELAKQLRATTPLENLY
jgi:hypothetical protein